MNKEQLIKRYNAKLIKLNQLEGDGEGIFDLIPEDYIGEITFADIEWAEDHFIKMNERYKELRLGIYA